MSSEFVTFKLKMDWACSLLNHALHQNDTVMTESYFGMLCQKQCKAFEYAEHILSKSYIMTILGSAVGN